MQVYVCMHAFVCTNGYSNYIYSLNEGCVNACIWSQKNDFYNDQRKSSLVP